ncbi:MAG: hypothetical protein M3361_12965 [Candidatus Tectomicrobia bacterium]|nr:hypothetical protein [Candidatus Tectomicrobia bacterium]
MEQPTQEALSRINDLMEQTGIDIVGVFEHVVLETQRGFNLDPIKILSWFPAEFLPEITQWLEQELKEQTSLEEEPTDQTDEEK